jgi:hypothetical protein
MFAVLAVVGAVLFVGCSGGIGPTLPSPDGPHNDAPINDAPVNDTPVNDTPVNDTPVDDGPVDDIVECPEDVNVTGVVSVPQVLGAGDESMQQPVTPVAGAFVAATDGTRVVDTRTDSTGRYCLSGLSPGDLILAFGAEGWTTEYRIHVGYRGTNTLILDQTLEAVARQGNPDDCPVVTASLADPAEVGPNELVGEATNTDSDEFGFYANGRAGQWIFDTTRSGDKVYTIQVDLVDGENTFRVFVANANCAVLSDPVSAPIDRRF